MRNVSGQVAQKVEQVSAWRLTLIQVVGSIPTLPNFFQVCYEIGFSLRQRVPTMTEKPTVNQPSKMGQATAFTGVRCSARIGCGTPNL